MAVTLQKVFLNTGSKDVKFDRRLIAWASYQKRKIVGCACAGNAGNVFPPPQVSDPDMYHGEVSLMTV